jgi:penicillin-binding protein 1C
MGNLMVVRPISGAEMAVPLLFDLFNTIDYDSDKEWFNKPSELIERKVCIETGLLPAKFCSSFTMDYFIKKISHNNFCNLYKEAYVNKEHSVEYCPNCVPAGQAGLPENYVYEAYPNYIPELEMWFKENGVKYKKHPKHNPNCEIRYTDSGPVILSPSENYEYLIEKKSNEEILLQAAPDASIRIHYWYINNKFYKSSPGEGIFLFLGWNK